MKNLLPLILCFLLLSGCVGEPGGTPAQTPAEEKTVIKPENPNVQMSIRLEEHFETREDLLDFAAAIDPETYPEGNMELSGLLKPLVTQIQKDGYMIILESDDGKTVEAPIYGITSLNGPFGQHYVNRSALIGEVDFTFEVSYIPANREKYVEAGIEAYLAKCYPGYPRSDNWKESGNVLNCYMATVMINGEELPCSVVIPVSGAPKIILFWDEKIILIYAFVKDDMDLSLFEHLTLEKVPLPPKEEAQARVQAREIEEIEAEAALPNDLIMYPQAEKYARSQDELLSFFATVDETTYPLEGNPGQGQLSPLVEAVRAEGYLLLPFADGAPAEPKEGHCAAYSRYRYGMPCYFVEGFRAGKSNNLYGYFAWYPSAEQAELLKQGTKALMQNREVYTQQLKDWYKSWFQSWDGGEHEVWWGSSPIIDYHEVIFTLNGEEQTGFVTDCVMGARLEFFYDGKFITILCFSKGTNNFDLSLFEHLTLEKVPLPE